MTSQTTEFAPPTGMVICDPRCQITMWDGTFDGNISPGTGVCMITEANTEPDNKIVSTSNKLVEHAEDSQASKSISERYKDAWRKTERLLGKAGYGKSLLLKAYVQQLEMSRLKLAQLELELERARQHGFLVAGATANMGLCGTVNPGFVAFELGYRQWIDEQERKFSELRSALLRPISEAELCMMVESILNHYCDLFHMKREAARADAFYLASGMWMTSVERFFLWIGGFRPSELINVVMSQLESLTEKQNAGIQNLKHSCIQAEDALTQGMEKLQQTLTQAITCLDAGAGSYNSQRALALEKLGPLESFIHQADHLREQTLQQMSRILTMQQAARGLVAFGEYFQRLRTLSSLWSSHGVQRLA